MASSPEPENASQLKAKWRLSLRAARAALEPGQRAEASTLICAHLERWLTQEWLPRFADAPIGVYLALPSEPTLDNLIARLLVRGVTLAAPRVEVEQGSIAMHQLTGLDRVEYGPWNVRQPAGASPQLQVGLALVPGLGFDGRGGRLGMGGGWYDRLLPTIPVAVGVAFACQRVNDLPLERHDRPMHGLFTERGEEMFLPLPEA